jgi:hypothetical protein
MLANMRRGRWIAAVVVVLVLAGLYVHGSFDRVLYPVGLNAHECARNGFGATFCGKELDEYRAKVKAVATGLEESKRNLQATEEQSRREQQERESKEAEEKTQTQAKERHELESKMAAEKAIFEREPEGSVASDEAKDEYEYDRAALQQLEVR